MERVPFAFMESVRGPLLEKVLELALTPCSTLGFVWRLESYEGLTDRMLASLDASLIGESLVTEWPGTKVGGGLATPVRHFRYDAGTKELLGSVSSLGSWHNPELPDDPHLLRSDGSTWLGSSTVDEE